MESAGGPSAVGLAPVADGGDGDGVFVLLVEEDAVVAAAEAEAGLGRLEFLDVAVASAQVAIEAVENLNRRFAIDSMEIGAGLGCPDDRHPRRDTRSPHLFRPNSCWISSWGIASPR